MTGTPHSALWRSTATLEGTSFTLPFCGKRMPWCLFAAFRCAFSERRSTIELNSAAFATILIRSSSVLSVVTFLNCGRLRVGGADQHAPA